MPALYAPRLGFNAASDGLAKAITLLTKREMLLRLILSSLILSVIVTIAQYLITDSYSISAYLVEILGFFLMIPDLSDLVSQSISVVATTLLVIYNLKPIWREINSKGISHSEKEGQHNLPRFIESGILLGISLSVMYIASFIPFIPFYIGGLKGGFIVITLLVLVCIAISYFAFGIAGKIVFLGIDALVIKDDKMDQRISPSFQYTASGTLIIFLIYLFLQLLGTLLSEVGYIISIVGFDPSVLKSEGIVGFIVAVIKSTLSFVTVPFLICSCAYLYGGAVDSISLKSLAIEVNSIGASQPDEFGLDEV